MQNQQVKIYHTASVSQIKQVAMLLKYMFANTPKDIHFEVAENGHISFRNEGLYKMPLTGEMPQNEAEARAAAQRWFANFQTWREKIHQTYKEQYKHPKHSFPDFFHEGLQFVKAEPHYHEKVGNLHHWRVYFAVQNADSQLLADDYVYIDLHRNNPETLMGCEYCTLPIIASEFLESIFELTEKQIKSLIYRRGIGDSLVPMLPTAEGEVQVTERGVMRGEVRDGFEYELKYGVPRVMFGIENNLKQLVAIYPYNYEEYSDGEMEVHYLEKGLDQRRTVSHYLPICKVKQDYKQQLISRYEDYTEMLSYLKKALDYISSTTNKDAKEFIEIISNKINQEDFYFLIIASYSRSEGGGRPYKSTYRGKDFYCVSFNPDKATSVFEGEKFIGGISVAVMPLAHELSHAYEMAVQDKNSYALGYKSMPVALDSLGDEISKWKTITIKIMPFITLDTGIGESNIYRFTTGTWQDSLENNKPFMPWTKASFEELFLKYKIIPLLNPQSSKYNIIDWYIKFVDLIKPEEYAITEEDFSKIKAELKKISMDFPDWYEYYGVSMQDRFASGLKGELELKVYTCSKIDAPNSLGRSYYPNKKLVSKSNPSYIPLNEKD